MSREPYLLPNGRVLRYSFHERLVHWLAGVSYVYLLLTGLAFWSPWLFWIAVILGGATISRELHPWFGLVFVVGVALMYRMWHRQMKETPSDKAWWAAIGHYIRNEDDQVPSADRFNPGQKFLFWGFFWNGILLLLTGLILWLPQYIPWNLRFLRLAAVFIHPGVRARHHRAFYHSRLYGHCNGARRFRLRHSRRRIACLGRPAPPHLV